MVGVLEDHRIAYFGVHKAASSTVKGALFELATGREGTHEEAHARFPSRKVTPEDFARYRDYWCFTVVRDPIKRFLSAYQNRVHDFGRASPGRRRLLIERLTRLGADPFFDGFRRYPTISEFIRHYDDYCRVSTDLRVHTWSIRNFIGDDLGYFDAVYDTTSVAKLQHDLSERVGRDVPFRARNESGSAPPRFEDLSHADRVFLIDHTSADYDLLTDYYHPPALGRA